ncbi:MAG: ATPase, T2SS/T4P/T4SS family, partial [Planctomycetota bacterium]
MLDSSAFVIRDLLRSRLITEDGATRAEQHAEGHACTVVESLSDLGLVSPRDLAITRAKICEQPFVDLAEFEIDIANARLMPRSVAESLGAFPLFVVDGVATVAIEDPLNLSAIDQVRQVLQLEIDPVVCETPRLRAMITRAYSLVQTHEDHGDDLAKFGDVDLASAEEPIVAAVNQIIVAGIELGASDIHINPDERVLSLRYRVDGALRSQQGPSLATHPSLVQRLKVMARLDLTQTRKPQDGKFAFTHKGRVTDVRLSVTPTVDGENV